MTNPSPRPALRKAEDADVHPAAPQPQRRPRTPRPPAAAAAATPAAAPEKPATAKRATKAAVVPAAAVSAAPVVAEAPAPAPAAKRAKRFQTPPAVPVEKKRKRSDFSGTTSDHLRRSDAPAAAAPESGGKGKRAQEDAALMTGAVVELTVSVPKKLRKAAKKEAAHRGLDLDAVVTDLLHAWVTSHR